MKMYTGMSGYTVNQWSADLDTSGWVIESKLLQLQKPKTTICGTIYQEVVNDL